MRKFTKQKILLFLSVLMAGFILITGCSSDKTAKKVETIGVVAEADAKVSNDFKKSVEAVLKVELPTSKEEIHSVVNSVVNDDSYLKNADNREKFLKLANQQLTYLKTVEISPKTEAEKEIFHAFNNYIGYQKGIYKSLVSYADEQDKFYMTTYVTNKSMSEKYLKSLEETLDKYNVSIKK
ncbi:hypothetical protein [Viridibacillus arvi]|uniref:hypothetical protein n=1 Tax=Viridibacillus arvi TaxID=263475 RepID=UPI00381D2FB7